MARKCNVTSVLSRNMLHVSVACVLLQELVSAFIHYCCYYYHRHRVCCGDGNENDDYSCCSAAAA
jgi:hypothetical protein